MKRAEILLAALGAGFLAYGAMRIQRGSGPMRDIFVDGGPACPAAPVRILEPAGGAPRGAVIVFHGLGANRIIMLAPGQQLAAAGLRVYLVDSPGHGDNTAPYSYAAEEQCARDLLERLEHNGEITPRRTILLGHSLGGALVIRLADFFLSAATIAVAPAPMIPPHRSPANLLVVAPQIEMGPIAAMEKRLEAAAGSERTSAEDFRQLRAFRMLRVPWRSHTSVLFDPATTRIIARWCLDALGAVGTSAPEPDFGAFGGGWLGMCGLILLFPAAASAAAQFFGFHVPLPDDGRPRALFAVVAWALAATLATTLLVFWVPLRPLRMYSADYLASLLLLAGVPLAFALGREARPSGERKGGAGPTTGSRVVAGALAGTTLGLVTILAFGGWMNWQLTDAWPNAARWERFPLLALILLPACFAEEFALGAPGALLSARRGARLLLFLALRAIFWGVVLFAVWAGWSTALLAVVFVAFTGLFSLAQRFAADAIRTRTGSTAAAAFFSAILGAWFLASAFPLA
jgi:pimeloyl-ACP methyl ester carboxylesterase